MKKDGDRGARLFWIDLEMTGLDPANATIVEIASVITDEDLEIVANGPELVIHATEEELAGIQERANKVIQQIAESDKFDLILQDPVVYASQRIDITDKVIKALADK